MSLKLDGKKLSLEIEEKLKNYISSHETITKRVPGLAVIRIGDDPASGVYVKNKEKRFFKVTAVRSYYLLLFVCKKAAAEQINHQNQEEELHWSLVNCAGPQ